MQFKLRNTASRTIANPFVSRPLAALYIHCILALSMREAKLCLVSFLFVACLVTPATNVLVAIRVLLLLSRAESFDLIPGGTQ